MRRRSSLKSSTSGHPSAFPSGMTVLSSRWRWQTLRVSVGRSASPALCFCVHLRIIASSADDGGFGIGSWQNGHVCSSSDRVIVAAGRGNEPSKRMGVSRVLPEAFEIRLGHVPSAVDVVAASELDGSARSPSTDASDPLGKRLALFCGINNLSPRVDLKRVCEGDAGFGASPCLDACSSPMVELGAVHRVAFCVGGTHLHYRVCPARLVRSKDRRISS